MTILVLLPGMDGTGSLFAPFLSACSREWETLVIAYPTDRALNYRELEAWVIAQLPRGRPFVVVAESFSGPVGIALGAAAPTGMVGLVLCCTFARNPRRLAGNFKGLLPILPIKFLTAKMYFLARRWLFGRFATRELDATLLKSLGAVPAAVLRARLLAVAEVDYRHLLAKLAMPVLYLRAREDRIVPSSAMDALARAVPHMEVASLSGPHLLLQAAPHAAVQAIDKFVRSLPSSAIK
jgi:pimeloyl-ACP methyl ester carboxylesterase